MCKLLYCGRMVSVKLLTRLILLWYNPLTEEDQRLRHCIGVFLQLYTHSHRYAGFVSVWAYGVSCLRRRNRNNLDHRHPTNQDNPAGLF